MAEGIPKDVEAFIAQHVNSVEQLEVLLLLRRYSEKEWTSEEVGRELATPADSAILRLRDLVTRQLLKKGKETNSFIYKPADREVAASIDHLAEIYGKRRVTIIGLIFSKPSEIQDFADAFRLREEE